VSTFDFVLWVEWTSRRPTETGQEELLRRILQLESGRDEIDVEESSLQISKSNEKKREATDIVKRGKKSEKEWTGQV